MTGPQHPIAAVTHPDPYPYYAELVAHRPVYRNAGLGLWVVSSAEAVTATLTSELCRVRPPAEPVPRALLGSPAGDIFRRLVRMNDGPAQRAFKPALANTLGAIGGDRAAEQSRHWAHALMADVPLRDFAFHLPVYVVGSLLGLPPSVLPQTALWTRDFVGCIAPMSSPEQIERGKVAAGHLLDLFGGLLASAEAGPDGGLLTRLAREASRAGGGDKDLSVANGIGLWPATR